MIFLKKHSLETVIFFLVITSLGLYFFLARPIVVRRQEVVKMLEEKLVQLQRYRDDPPSAEMIDKLSREKEELEKQYKEVVKILNFAQRISLPKDTGDPLFFDEQIEKFERQIEQVEDELGRLAERSGINIPERLGFSKERPESREELSLLLSQLALVRELVILIIETGVGELSLLNPQKGATTLPQERIEKLEFELRVKTKMPALTSFLYRIANYSYFFTVQDLEIRSVAVKREERTLPEVREREGRRRRMSPQRLEILQEGEGRREEMQPGETEKPAEEVGRELEVRLIVSSRLVSPGEEEKK